MQKKKTAIITARMTPQTKAEIQHRAKQAGMTVTDYLVTCALDKEIIQVNGLDEILSELKAQGRNLNQLTTLANMGRIKTNGRVPRYNSVKEEGLSNRFVRGTHMVLHQALDQAVKERIIPSNPTNGCRIPQLEKKEMKVIAPEQVGSYLNAAKENGVLPMFYLELTSGLRRGELLALLWEDLDIAERTISVTKTLSAKTGKMTVSPPKTQNSIRKVVIPTEAVELLVEEHEKHPDSPYMFPSPVTGNMYHPDAIGRVHKKLLKQAGLPDIRFHDLRHTFATLALQNGVDVKTLSSMLGHYSAGFTLDTYTHATMKMQIEAADKLGGFMAQTV